LQRQNNQESLPRLFDKLRFKTKTSGSGGFFMYAHWCFIRL
jgi:hypothetical protein